MRTAPCAAAPPRAAPPRPAGPPAPRPRPGADAAAVVASFSILGDMVRQLAGDRVRLRTMAGPNVDAHSFQPRPSDAEALRGAALVVRNGLGFDTWMDRLFRAAGYRGAGRHGDRGRSPRAAWRAMRTAMAAARTAADAFRGPGQVPDPHAWQDLRLGPDLCPQHRRGTRGRRPGRRRRYRARAAAYAARLEALDAWVRQQVAAVPERAGARWSPATTPSAISAPPTASPSWPRRASRTEPSPAPRQVAALIRQIRAEGITAVFIEKWPTRHAGTAGAGGRRQRARPALRRCAVRPAGPAPGYEAMFRHNVGLMVPAMRGAP